jgi:hypothetical protein
VTFHNQFLSFSSRIISLMNVTYLVITVWGWEVQSLHTDRSPAYPKCHSKTSNVLAIISHTLITKYFKNFIKATYVSQKDWGGQEQELLLKVSSTCKVLLTIVKIHTVVLWTSVSLIITMALEVNIANYPIKIWHSKNTLF